MVNTFSCSRGDVLEEVVSKELQAFFACIIAGREGWRSSIGGEGWRCCIGDKTQDVDDVSAIFSLGYIKGRVHGHRSTLSLASATCAM
jgi:hypothetical protein